ncbi:MAG: alpha/beta hydrolase, partial [Deltaproteobacteria bacterium]|nr:alpha/beta hydrolase [Deltaproteobacteria bacterium]
KQYYQGGNLRTQLETYHGANTDCAFRGWNDTWLHPDFVNWNIESYLPGIAVPMLAIQGQDDHYGTPAQVQAMATKTRTELETVMLPRCGHSPHRDQPELTLTAMKRFIRKVFHSKTAG